jgi:hypothetical protein
VRAASDEAAEFVLEHTTLDGKNSPSSAHAGSTVRAQNASAIPSSDAHTSVAANGHGARCCEDRKLVAAVADVWCELTGQDPDLRMKRSRPATTI